MSNRCQGDEFELSFERAMRGTPLSLVPDEFAFIKTDNHEWMKNGVCFTEGVDPDIFFPDLVAKRGVITPEGIAKARAYCFRCPVQTECMVFAITHDEKFGIFGGMAPKELRHLKNQMAWDLAKIIVAKEQAQTSDPEQP